MDLIAFSLALFIFVVNSLAKVDARVCKYQFEGTEKYYMCPGNEYCCSVGCCISPSFQFYQLWYYWLMVIFMFVVCSGGQWWYRYWMNERYVSELRTTMPHHHHHHHHHQQVRSHHYANQHTNQTQSSTTPASGTSSIVTRVSYHPQTQAVFLDNLWKPTSYTGRAAAAATGPPPSYSASTHQGEGPSSGIATGSLAIPITGSPKPAPPYSQIYGPPPSYESVVGLSSMAAEVAQTARAQQQQQLQTSQPQETPPPPPPFSAEPDQPVHARTTSNNQV